MKIHQLLSKVKTLEATEILVLKKALKARENQVESNIVVEQKASEIAECPHCHSANIGGHGTMNGHKRFKCKDCNKTFNAFTNTAFARLRKVNKHIANAKCMMDGLSVRATAKKIGVTKSTAFLWRHKFLLQIETINPSQLSGIVEADETYFRISYKGQKHGLPRKAHKRATPSKFRGLSHEQIPVLVARDRSSNETLSTILRNRSTTELNRVLKSVLSSESILCADGATAYKQFGKQNGIMVKSTPANPKKKIKGNVYHIQNVNSYDSRLKGWMFRFKGVATKYLSNYLGWHRLLDNQKDIRARKFLMLAIG